MRRSIVLCTAATLLMGMSYDSSSADTARRPTQVVLLGTGTPNADPQRAGPAVAVVVNDTPYLVDAGTGIVRRSAAAYESGIAGLQVNKLQTVFLTHLHSDHTIGLPDLLLTPWVLERSAPLTVLGPRGTRKMMSHITKAYHEDVRLRINGLEPANRSGHHAKVTEIAPGIVYRDENVEVTAFRVEHGSWKHAYGYRFRSADRTIVISGDCTYSRAVAEHCNGCDVLVHEVYSQRGFATRPPEWQRYHASFHTSTQQLAQLANEARPQLLVLYHQLTWGRPEEELVAEIQANYSGRVVSGRDLDVY